MFVLWTIFGDEGVFCLFHSMSQKSHPKWVQTLAVFILLMHAYLRSKNIFYTLKSLSAEWSLWELLERETMLLGEQGAAELHPYLQQRGFHLSLLTCPGGMQHYITVNFLYIFHIQFVLFCWAKSSFWAWETKISVHHTLHPWLSCCVKSYMYINKLLDIGMCVFVWIVFTPTSSITLRHAQTSQNVFIANPGELLQNGSQLLQELQKKSTQSR